MKNFNADKSKMIPLKDATYRKNPFVATLKGNSIKKVVNDGGKETPYEINFDTGSWTTSIPGGALDFDHLTILEKNIRDPWQKLADKVSGQLILESEDGETQYVVDDYIFFATKQDENTYMPDDRGLEWGNSSIMGAFPSPQPGDKLPSLPYAIVQKYQPDNLGFGFYSDHGNQISNDKSVPLSKTYLSIGNQIDGTNPLSWRDDIPNWRAGELDFCPEATPGFKITIHFLPDYGERIETASGLIATIDTGAPDLTLRLGESNPHLDRAFSPHFESKGPYPIWRNDPDADLGRALTNAIVTVKFTDSEGETHFYTFVVGDDPLGSPNTLFAGHWEGDVPWAVDDTKPKNRINLGNTLYLWCPVVMFDIKNKRVGIGFQDALSYRDYAYSSARVDTGELEKVAFTR